MNWEMISAIGQMLGAIGVIISIVYLAAQIRNQNKESQRAAMNVLTSHWSDLNRTLAENPDMAALWLRALRSFDDLDAESKLRFGAHLGRFRRVSAHIRAIVARRAFHLRRQFTTATTALRRPASSHAHRSSTSKISSTANLLSQPAESINHRKVVWREWHIKSLIHALLVERNRLRSSSLR
jgi:hypothetical protein